MDSPSERVLVIDMRTQRFGFVLLDASGVLIDWGICGYHTNVPDVLHRKLSRICAHYAPIRILVRHVKHRDPRGNELLNSYLRVLQKEAGLHLIPLRIINASEVREYFLAQGRNNKHEVAQVVAASFPELAW